MQRRRHAPIQLAVRNSLNILSNSQNISNQLVIVRKVMNQSNTFNTYTLPPISSFITQINQFKEINYVKIRT